LSPVRYHTGRFPPAQLDWQRLMPLVGPAHAAIARYNAMLHSLPNAGLLIGQLIKQEAVLSSRIEGTQPTFGQVLKFEAEGKPNDESTAQKADVQKVLNYADALLEAMRLRQTLPLSQRLIKQTHAVLMRGVRGTEQEPGHYRRVSNWIGPQGASREQARFIPCDAAQIEQAMAEWEGYLHSETPDKLIQLAILHAEFEAIHPFLDGNGRLGRLIVTLYLVAKDIVPAPHFYISEYLERNREEYTERLLAVSRDDDWTGWGAFFLQALTRQAASDGEKTRKIFRLYNEKKDWIQQAAHSQYGMLALDWIFANPVFLTSRFFAESGIPKPTAIRILRELRKQDMLSEVQPGRGRRPAMLAFPELLAIAGEEDGF